MERGAAHYCSLRTALGQRALALAVVALLFTFLRWRGWIAAAALPPLRLGAVLVGAFYFQRLVLPRLLQIKWMLAVGASVLAMLVLRLQQYSWFITLAVVLSLDAVVITILLLLVAPNLPRRCFGPIKVIKRSAIRSVLRSERALVPPGDDEEGEGEGEETEQFIDED